MQIFGQNIFGIFDTESGVYSAELELLLHRLINAQLYITSNNSLVWSGLTMFITNDTGYSAGLALGTTR